MSKPNPWYMKTGSLLPNERYCQSIHNLSILNTHSTNWKQELKEKMNIRNINLEQGGLYYSQKELEQMWKEAVEENEMCSICFQENLHIDYLRCDYGHTFHLHCPGFHCSNTFVQCPLCKTDIRKYHSKYN